MPEKVEIDIVANDKTSGIIQGIFQGMGQQLANLALQIPGAILNFGKDILAEATEAQDGLAQLEAVIKSTGGAAGMTADELTKMADKLSETTKFSDDAIIGGENLLLTFTNIGKDVFPDATKAILDVSTAMNQDLKSSAIQLGKALNDPAQGISALTRIGVTFTDEQKNLIESLVASGDMAKAQAVILKELEREFGGSAEAAGKTFGGQLEILKNRLDNVKESIGMALLPVLNELGEKYMPVILPMIEKFGAKIAEWIPAIGPVIDRALNLASTIWSYLEPALVAIGDWWDKNGTAIMFKAITLFDSLWVGANKVWSEIQNNFLPIFNALQEWWNENGDFITEKAGKLWDTIKEGSTKVFENVQKLVNDLLPRFASWWDENGGKLGETIGLSFDSLNLKFQILSDVFNLVLLPILEHMMQTILDIGSLVLSVATGDWKGAWTAFKDIAKQQTELIQDAIKGMLDVILRQFGTTFDEVSKIVTKKIADIAEQIHEITKTISGIGSGTGLTLSTDLYNYGYESVMGHKAKGGPVMAGQSYLVGEQGAEIFKPSQSGAIIPGGFGGGDISIVLQYQPNVALGNQYEAENILLPFILNGIRAAQANGLVPTV